MKNYSALFVGGLLAVSSLLAGCDKKADPFVDRVVAPVLVVVEGASDGGGLTAEPVALKTISAPVTMSVQIFELDKSGILNKAVGIDSIPVASLSVKLTKRDGTALATLTTDQTGKVSLTKTWSDLGITAPAVGSTVSLTWSGEYKGQAFSRLSRVQGVK